MGPAGSIPLLEKQMDKLNVPIMAICETRWKEFGDFRTATGTNIYHSGSDNGIGGVAFFVQKKFCPSVESYKCINNRIMTLRMNSHPFCLTIVCIYAPTSTSSEEEAADFYKSLQEAVDATPKNDILTIMGDFNAKIGNVAVDNTVGAYGLGQRNERGEMLLDFCLTNNLLVTNTVFCHHKRKVYTWKSPGDRHRNQIDYILIKNRWKNGILNSRAFPGADMNSDHNPVIAKIRIKLKKLKKPVAKNIFNLADLGDPETRLQFETSLKIKVAELDEIENLETLKEGLCNGMLTTTEEVVGTHKFIKKNDWISDQTMQLIELKSEAHKRNDESEFKRLKAAVQRELRKDKAAYWKEKCNKINDLVMKNAHNTMSEIKKLHRHKVNKPCQVKDKGGRVLSETQEIRSRWGEYVSELYSSQTDASQTANPMDAMSPEESAQEFEPDILMDEVRAAISSLSNNKATGDDGVASEMLKASGETGVKIMHKICNIIWKSKKWPGSWKKLVMIALYKKGDSAVCENYRTLSLISHASKVLLNIIVKRIEQSYETELNINQAGFRRGVSTRDQIFNLQQIIEKYLENGKPIYALFLDYSKAFDSVSHIGLWKILKKLNTPSHIIQLFQSLYEDCTAVVRLNCGTTDDININRGVRQGCPASPILFNLYTEQIVRESADRCEQGLKVSGKLINNLRYADDTVLLAESQEGLQELADTVNGAGVKRDLHLNIKKTKAMVITKNNENCTIRINSRPIDCVDRFVYLGGVVTKNGDTAEMIKTRICSAKARFTDFESVWKDKESAETENKHPDDGDMARGTVRL